MPDDILVKKISWMIKEIRKITKDAEKGVSKKKKKLVVFTREEKKVKEDSLYSIENIRLLETLASHALIAFENTLLYEKTKRMTISDGLTGIYNYRYFQIRLKEEINRSNRYKFPLGLMMIDLDNFKKYNDTYGHLSGDKMLKRVVGIINKNIRIIDVLCRYGGDEFVVILPNTDMESTGISSVAERIRKKVEQSSFVFGKGKKRIKMGLSVGVSFYPNEAKNMKELILFADKAMYKAKKAGGNKSVIYQTKKNKRRKKI
ncbi:GGDEF domain-containing protein [bacterium]|nr:GGDEF domain-containing protein [bacterium]